MSHRKIAVRAIAVAVGGMLIAGMGASSAYAGAVATTAGAKVEHVVGGGHYHQLDVWDTARDSKFVKGTWKSNRGSSGSVVNKDGFDKLVQKVVTSRGEKVTQIRACRSSGGIQPMKCGNPVKTGYR